MIRTLLLTALAVTSCTPTPIPHQLAPPGAMQEPAAATGVHVTGTYPMACHRAPADDPRLPVRACTPGSTRPDINDPSAFSSTICRPGWTATVRPPASETDRVKTLAMAAYGIPAAQRGQVELDHLIPLELNGSNVASNLWPELSDEPGHGFRNTKDGVENRLKAAVCSHRVALPAAQNAIAADWTTAEVRLGLSKR